MCETGRYKILDPVILHLAKEDQEQEHRNRLAEADIVLAQLTSDQYHIPYLRSNVIKHQLGDRSIIWPNIFYAGQQPYLRYFSSACGGRLLGPLEAMHDLRIYARWRASRGLTGPFPEDFVNQEFERSVQQTSTEDLRKKEAGCDVEISDIISSERSSDRQFFTFNHPARVILEVLSNRILSKLGENGPVEWNDGSEPLARYLVPSSWQAETAPEYKGNPCLINEDGSVSIEPTPTIYTSSELEEAFFEIYDSSSIFLKPSLIRRTPNFVFDPQWDDA